MLVRTIEKDDANAANWFFKASQQADAPYFAARIYAELLRNQGRNEEAYVFLKELHNSLPNVPFAQKGIILERIRELENTLKIPLWQRFEADKSLGASESESQFNAAVPAPHQHEH